MLISKTVYVYLKDYMKWIEKGAVGGKPYYRHCGLCDNTYRFVDDNCELQLIMEELDLLFEEEGLNSLYPFGEENYNNRVRLATQHEDPTRLQWIIEHITEYEVKLEKLNMKTSTDSDNKIRVPIELPSHDDASNTAVIISNIQLTTTEYLKYDNKCNNAVKIFNKLFFTGGPVPSVKKGIDENLAYSNFLTVIRSMSIKHETKQGCCAWMLENWFEIPEDTVYLHNSFVIKAVRKAVEPLSYFTKIADSVLVTELAGKPIIGFLNPSDDLNKLKFDNFTIKTFTVDGKDIVIGYSSVYFEDDFISDLIKEIQGKNDPIVKLFGGKRN